MTSDGLVVERPAIEHVSRYCVNTISTEQAWQVALTTTLNEQSPVPILSNNIPISQVFQRLRSLPEGTCTIGHWPTGHRERLGFLMH